VRALTPVGGGTNYRGFDFFHRWFECVVSISWNVAPPGYYMLVILTSNGVPSKARIIRLR
jgi:hypothetical protein